MITDINLTEYDNIDYGALELFKISCRSCNRNLASNDPASQYQKQKLIQNTVRVPASLYTDNLGALNVYERPNPLLGVNWKQMSDRAIPHVQTAYVPSRGSSTRHSITRNRPGAMSPGGVGVDMKHGSYDRYLARIKGKAPLRRGVIPPGFGVPQIPFNQAFPIYGGKTVKTSIVNNCNCPIGPKQVTIADDLRIYQSPLQGEINAVTYKFSVGDFVYAVKDTIINGPYYKAFIKEVVSSGYVIEFVDDGTISFKTAEELLIYFNCGTCITPLSIASLSSLFYRSLLNSNNELSPICTELGILSNNLISSNILNFIDAQIRKQLYPNINSSFTI